MKTRDHLEKDCRKRGNKGGWKSWNVAKAAARNRERSADNVMSFTPTSAADHDDHEHDLREVIY